MIKFSSHALGHGLLYPSTLWVIHGNPLHIAPLRIYITPSIFDLQERFFKKTMQKYQNFLYFFVNVHKKRTAFSAVLQDLVVGREIPTTSSGGGIWVELTPLFLHFPPCTVHPHFPFYYYRPPKIFVSLPFHPRKLFLPSFRNALSALFPFFHPCLP